MEVVLGKLSGFCGGVNKSVLMARKTLEKQKRVYCLGDLVHNKQVVDNLKEKGLIVVDSLKDVPLKAHVIIRAHGVDKEIYKEALKKKIDLIDLTCVNVLKIHKIAEDLANNGFYIILTGDKNHPEVKGTISFCGSNSSIIENEEQLNEVVLDIKKSGLKKVALISQTTYSLDKFDCIQKRFEDFFADKYELSINNTICNATELRQKEVKEIAKQVEAMVIIGGKHSSNTVKLYDISKSICQNTYLIETVLDLNDEISRFSKVGVMAGASTSKELIDEILVELEMR